MSEIKGQLLGIVLTIAVFGVVFGILTTAFSNVSDNIESRMIEAGDKEYTNDAKAYSLHY